MEPTMEGLLNLYARFWFGGRQAVYAIRERKLTNVYPAHLADRSNRLTCQELAVDYSENGRLLTVIFEKDVTSEQWTQSNIMNGIIYTTQELIAFAEKMASSLPGDYRAPIPTMADLWAVYFCNYPALDSIVRPLVSSGADVYPFVVTDQDILHAADLIATSKSGEIHTIRPDSNEMDPNHFYDVSKSDWICLQDVLSFLNS